MTKSLVRLLLCCVAICLPIEGQLYKEKYRLQLHFSMPSGWSNDPNGLVYYNGFYHLFYQYNPVSTVFGSMHWGHAKSTDLIHWENMPVALKPYEKGDIFSGCCVVDANNVTGIQSTVPALIAIYTLHNDQSQTQALAYANDESTIAWTHYDANPIIPNPGIADFRDPNIFERNGMFYMTLAVKDRIRFLASTDLKNWKTLSDFGDTPNEGDKSGVWECPSMVTLKDEQGNEHDILFVSENGDDRGSLLQYFVGKFNGTTFNTYNQSRILWADNGFDNYAAIPYHNDPNGRIIIIGWLSNWLYAQVAPTKEWRGQMTIPRELGLQTIDGNIHLIQRPINELEKLTDSTRTWSLKSPLVINGTQSIDFTSQIPFKTGSMLSLVYAFDIKNAASGRIGLNFSNNHDEYVSFYYDLDKGIYEFDRRQSGNVTFSPRFADTLARANRIWRNSTLVSARIILDTASIEIFADFGLNTFSALFFPTEPFENIQVIGAFPDSEASVILQQFDVRALNSIWSNSGTTMTPYLLNMTILTSFWLLLSSIFQFN